MAREGMCSPVHPHTRGDHVLRPTHQGTRFRFTPTRVGTTTACVAGTPDCIGSPPHAWGPPLRVRRTPPPRPVHPHTRGDHDGALGLGEQVDRFTPTRVGTTPHGLHLSVHGAVHPHTRGDHIDRAMFHLRLNGSPPHAWGPRRQAKDYDRRIRFTPTRVGTTQEVRT